MFALVGQVERAVPRPRGVPGDRPGDDVRRPGDPRRRDPRRRGRPRGASATPIRAAAVGPDRARRCCRSRRTSSTRCSRPEPRSTRSRRRPRGRSPTRSGRSSSSSPPPSGRSSSPAAASCAPEPRPTCFELAELLSVPVIAGWRRGDVISNDHPLYLGMAGYGSPAVGPRAPRARRCHARARLPAVGDHELRLHDPGPRASAGPTSTSSRCAAATACPHRRSRSARTPGRSCAPPSPGSRRAVLDAALVDARRATNDADRAGLGGGDRRRRDRLVRPGRPSGPRHRDAPSRPARRRDRRDRCRQLRALARPSLSGLGGSASVYGRESAPSKTNPSRTWQTGHRTSHTRPPEQPARRVQTQAVPGVPFRPVHTPISRGVDHRPRTKTGQRRGCCVAIGNVELVAAERRRRATREPRTPAQSLEPRAPRAPRIRSGRRARLRSTAATAAPLTGSRPAPPAVLQSERRNRRPGRERLRDRRNRGRARRIAADVERAWLVVPSRRITSESQSRLPSSAQSVTARTSAPRAAPGRRRVHASSSQRICSSRVQPGCTSVIATGSR